MTTNGQTTSPVLISEATQALFEIASALEDIGPGRKVDADVGALVMLTKAVHDGSTTIAQGLGAVAEGLHAIADAIRDRT